MNLIISLLSHFLEPFRMVVNYDGGIPPGIVTVGIIILGIVGLVIIAVIVFAVVYLIRHRNKNNQP